jgi:D-alanyl-D-alanine-carboxypeptidase/D-alanyl-D-alanine-endopeptidase
MPITRRQLCAAAAAATVLPGQAHARSVDPSDAELSVLLGDRVGQLADPRNGVGLAGRIVGAGPHRPVSAGHFGAPSGSATGSVVFEIGSVTKTFMGLLLCDMVLRGEVRLDDPVDRHLPRGVTTPKREGRVITLIDLATHTSGLPFMPGREVAQTSEAYYQFIAAQPLESDIGTRWDYSDLDYWLLCRALSHRAGAPFNALLTRRVITPLGLVDTAFAATPAMRTRLAVGHDAALSTAPPFTEIPGYALVAADYLYSTVDDLARFVACAMNLTPSPLARAFAFMLGTRRTIDAQADQALGCVVQGRGAEELIYQDGGTFGFASAVAWDRRRRIGDVVLANQVGGTVDIARHLMRPSAALKPPVVNRSVEIVLPAATLARYAGRYAADGEGVFTLALEDGLLAFLAPDDWGLPKLKLHAENEHSFYATELPLKVEVETDAGGASVAIDIHPPRGQAVIRALRQGG